MIAIRRANVTTVIDQNPSLIAIQREERLSDGAGGYTTGRTTLPQQKVRIFFSSSSQAREGEANVDTKYEALEMLAAYDADLQRGDMFEIDGQEYRIRAVRPARAFAGIVSHQCELERMM